MRVALERLVVERPLGPLGRVALTVEILVAYAGVRASMPRGSIYEVVEQLRAAPRRPDGGVQPGSLAAARRLGDAVSRALPLLPTDTRCLMRSLVLLRLLSRRSIAARLVIGVRAEPSFAAHAWVEHDGHPLLPASGTTFQRLAEL